MNFPFIMSVVGFVEYTRLYSLWTGPTVMYYLSLDKPPRALSAREKHTASLVSWSEFCLFWLLGWLTAWTAASCLFARDGTATLRRSMCLNPLLCACTQQPPWCCGC